MNEFEKTEGVRSDANLDRPQDDDSEARVEQLTSEIDETRDDLSQTIAEIGQKLDPGTIARDATETVRNATIGKVEQMTYGAQETWRDVRTGNPGSIVDTITSNPIPAGMVALGLGMLFMKRGAQGSPDRYGTNPYRGREDAGRGAASWQSARWDRPAEGGSPLDRVGSTVTQAGDKIGEAADQAGQKVSGVMEQVGQTAEQLPQQAGFYLDRGGNQVRRFIDENPLGAGVIALAAGAAIGLLLPTTSIERDTIGQARDQLVDKVEGAAHQAIDQAEQELDRTQASPA